MVATPYSFLLTLLLFLGMANLSKASQNGLEICDQAAQYAAQKTGVPISVLQAITRTETGRKRNGTMQPWPWTVNMEGKGVWFPSEDQARAYVYKNYKRGARSFDIGCFQINYKWHGREFASIEEMFQPIPNALYAAKFLQKLYREKQDWSKAAGAYHSRTAKYANKYQIRFNSFRNKLLANDTPAVNLAIGPLIAEVKTGTPTAASRPSQIRVNTYPLLKTGTRPNNLGSLVPLVTQPAVSQPFIRLANDG